MSEYRRRSATGAVVLGGLVSVVALLPMFLTGALAVQLMSELRFGTAALGLAIALSRAAGAVTSPFLGKLTDRLGATLAIRVSSLMAATASLGIALTAYRWSTLALWLMLSGGSQALGQPAANRLLAGVVDPRRLGLAFGVKQSAPPAAAMLSGISVPVLAVTLGWRSAFAGAAVFALTIAVLAVPPSAARRKARRSVSNPTRMSSRVLYLFGAVFGLGTGVSSIVTTFYVDSAERAGTDPSMAGTILAVASLCTIAVRVAAGAVSDRRDGGHLRLCAGLVLIGSFGLAALATGQPGWMGVGAIVAALGTWGFNGVFWFALISIDPRSPGRVTGAVAPGGLVGATLGPLVFGVVAESLGFSLAWSATAVIALVAVIALFLLERQIPGRSPPDHQLPPG